MEKLCRQEYNAPALEKGLDILELLASSAQPMTKKQIADTVGRSVGEIFRVLSVLVRRGYVSFDEEYGCYMFSMKMFTVANQYPPQYQLLNIAKPLMKRLSEKVNQSCHISWYDNQHLVVIGHEASPYKMGFNLKIGAKLDVCSSGSGIVLLSFCEPTARKDILDNSGGTDSEKQKAISLIEPTRKQGYYIGASPQISGITNVSVPIFIGDELFSVLTVPYITLDSNTVHHEVDSIETTKDELMSVCDAISRRLTL